VGVSSIGFERLISLKKKETLNFRVSSVFKQRLIEAANKERRSLTNYLEITLTRLWDEQEASADKRRERRKQEN